METILNLITEYGEVTLISFVLFWVFCAVVVALCVPTWLKNAPEMPDDFDVEKSILARRKN